MRLCERVDMEELTAQAGKESESSLTFRKIDVNEDNPLKTSNESTEKVSDLHFRAKLMRVRSRRENRMTEFPIHCVYKR